MEFYQIQATKKEQLVLLIDICNEIQITSRWDLLRQEIISFINYKSSSRIMKHDISIAFYSSDKSEEIIQYFPWTLKINDIIDHLNSYNIPTIESIIKVDKFDISILFHNLQKVMESYYEIHQENHENIRFILIHNNSHRNISQSSNIELLNHPSIFCDILYMHLSNDCDDNNYKSILQDLQSLCEYQEQQQKNVYLLECHNSRPKLIACFAALLSHVFQRELLDSFLEKLEFDINKLT